MLQRGIENASFPRFPVDAGYGQGHQVMVGSDAARHRDDGGTVAHHGEEERVFQAELRQVGHGLHDAERHEQVHGPDADREEQEGALVRHAVEAAEALSHGGEPVGDLAEETDLDPETEHGPEEDGQEHHEQHQQPPEGELQARGHGRPDLLGEEGSEFVLVEHQREAQHEEDGHDVPEAFHQHRAEHVAEAGLAADIAAAQHFAGPGDGQVGEVADVVGVPGAEPAGLESRRAQEQPPAERPEDKRADRRREERHQPAPSRQFQSLDERRPVDTPQRQPQQHPGQADGQDELQYRFNVHKKRRQLSRLL